MNNYFISDRLKVLPWRIVNLNSQHGLYKNEVSLKIIKQKEQNSKI